MDYEKQTRWVDEQKRHPSRFVAFFMLLSSPILIQSNCIDEIPIDPRYVVQAAENMRRREEQGDGFGGTNGTLSREIMSEKQDPSVDVVNPYKAATEKKKDK